MNAKRKLTIGLVATVTVAAAVLTTVSQSNVEPTPTVEASVVAAATEVVIETTGVPSNPGGCAYQWAYQDAPELTANLDAAVKDLNPNATARAEAYGENCVHEDGSVTFGAMETDFYVQLPVDDLNQKEEFGNWLAQAMTLVTQIPREKLKGPNYGFVEFAFEKSEAERIVFRVPVQQYLNEGQGKTGSELLNLYYHQP